MTYRRKSYNVWVRQYKPVQNHVTANSPYDGTMFETFGPDREYVLSVANSHNPSDLQRVWTLLDAGGRDLTIASGYHLVNRLGYFITEIPYTGDDLLEVVG